MQYIISIAALVVLCGVWVLFQRWIDRHMPGSPGIGRRCDGCPGIGHCEGHRECESGKSTTSVTISD